jgi:hypothetical protein
MEKSQKIVILTSTPDEFVKKIAKNVVETMFFRGKRTPTLWATYVTCQKLTISQ